MFEQYIQQQDSWINNYYRQTEAYHIGSKGKCKTNCASLTDKDISTQAYTNFIIWFNGLVKDKHTCTATYLHEIDAIGGSQITSFNSRGSLTLDINPLKQFGVRNIW